MQFYEGGLSVAIRLGGNALPYKTYIGVVDFPQEKTVEQAFAELTQSVQSLTKIVKSVPELLLLQVENGDTYTLAHEILISDSTITYHPANILRHFMNRLFNFEVLYIDENNEIVDLTHRGVRYAENRKLEFLHPKAQTILSLKPDCLMYLFELWLKYDFTNSSDVEHYLCIFRSSVRITNLDELRTFIQENFVKFMDYLNKFPRLGNYFTKVLGLKIDVRFEEPPPGAPLLDEEPDEIFFSKGAIIENEPIDFDEPE